VQSIAELQGVGADEVIAEGFETSLEIFSRVLRHYDIPSNVIEREVNAARMEHYGLALGETGTPRDRLDALASLGIHRAIDIIEVEPGSDADGEHPAALQLRARTGATAVAIARDGAAHISPGPDFRFRTGDSVVLVGDADALEAARPIFVVASAP
jgi:CPA2 family monovalent cation:H+ antiporter-2